jgi:inorganic pyrophosphatase
VLGFLLLVLAGCGAVPVQPNPTRLEPAFASPCMPDMECGLLDRCADTDYRQCDGFVAAEGLRREISGRYGQLDFRAQPVRGRESNPVSLWHDIPLLVSDDDQGLVVNAFFEISRRSQAKMEVNKWLPYNPIWQDRSRAEGQEFLRPRYYAWSPAPGNYGALPRTWENVLEPDPLTGYPGDTDPIDVIDFGDTAAPTGLVAQVKVIGALGMIDGTDGQTDWKVCVINLADPRAQDIGDISDVDSVRRDQWGLFWRFYKTSTGNRQNFFYDPSNPGGFSADPVWLGAEQAALIVRNSAEAYRKLRSDCLNLRVDPPYWVPGCTVEGIP